MLEKEVRRNILKILYEDSMKEAPRDFSSEEFVEMIPGATAKQVGQILEDLNASGYFDYADFYDQGMGVVSGLTSRAISFYEDHYLDVENAVPEVMPERLVTMGKNVFVVHGHDVEMKVEVAGLLKYLGLNPIILSEQPNGGRTIIEKFEKHSQEVGYAVVLMSDKDDLGRAVEERVLRPRARQNVILELGYFIGRLGRSRVCVLKKETVEDPSDILGIVYTPYVSGSKDWQSAVIRELKAAGYVVESIEETGE